MTHSIFGVMELSESQIQARNNGSKGPDSHLKSTLTQNDSEPSSDIVLNPVQTHHHLIAPHLAPTQLPFSQGFAGRVY